MKALHNMSDDELMEEWTKAGAAAEKAKARAKEFHDEHEDRLVAAAARARLDSMNDTERAALAQLLQAEGIESEEEVNGNG